MVKGLETIAQTFTPDGTISQGLLQAGFEATDSLIHEPEGLSLLSALAGLEQDTVIIGIIFHDRYKFTHQYAIKACW